MRDMARLRRRRWLALLAIGLVLFAAFVPAASANVAAVVLTLVWLLPLAAAVTRIRRETSNRSEQSGAVPSLVAPRPPPSLVTFA
jgi:hypothetical protein